MANMFSAECRVSNGEYFEFRMANKIAYCRALRLELVTPKHSKFDIRHSKLPNEAAEMGEV